MLIRCLGISVHELLAARQNSQKLSRSETLPGKRQAIPTIAIGIVVPIPSDWLALSRLGTPFVSLIDAFISLGSARVRHEKKVLRLDANKVQIARNISSRKAKFSWKIRIYVKKYQIWSCYKEILRSRSSFTRTTTYPPQRIESRI